MADGSDERPLTPVQRLELSRQALWEQMSHEARLDAGPAEAGRAGRGAPAGSASSRIASHMLRSWWRRHPAHVATDLALPLVREYARARPWHLVGGAAAAGAALVLLRPWRMVSLAGIGGMVWGALRSPELNGLAQAMLHLPERDP